MQHTREKEIDFFFVRGYHKSGTNWIQNLLNLHPDIYCHGELHLGRVKKTLDLLWNNSPSLLCNNIKIKDNSKKDFEEFVIKRMMEVANIFSKKPIKLFGDRSPGEILPILLENKKHILIIRDGRDVMVSWAYHLLRRKEPISGDNFFRFEFNRTLFKKDNMYFINNKKNLFSDRDWFKKYAKEWAMQIKKDLQAVGAIKNGKIKADIYSVKYEEIHKNVEKIRKEMYLFLGVNPQTAFPITKLEYPAFGGSNRENPASHYRKGIVGEWRGYFTKENVDWFKEVAGEELIELGYEENNNWTI